MDAAVRCAPALAVLLVSACASTEAAKAPLDPLAEAPRTEARGAIVWYRNGQVLQRASWDEARIARGSGNGPVAATYQRTVDRRWKVFCEGAYELVEVSGNRITGPNTTLTSTRVDGGFLLDGLWCGSRFSLLLTGQKAVAEGREYLRGPDGGYTCPALSGTRVVLYGEANRLEDPPWPQMALAALAAQWGRGGSGGYLPLAGVSTGRPMTEVPP